MDNLATLIERVQEAEKETERVRPNIGPMEQDAALDSERAAYRALVERLMKEVDELTGGRGSTGPSWAYHDGVRDQLLAEIDVLRKQLMLYRK